MLTAGWWSLRARWPALVGPFVASAFGVAMTASLGLLLSAATSGPAASSSSPERTARDDTALIAGIGLGVVAVGAVVVTAAATSLACTQRRRELTLLRLAGATSQQLRRMLLVEALLVAVAAAVTGCALAPSAEAGLVNRLVASGVAPPDLQASLAAWPLAMAGGIGLVVVPVGVLAGSRRTRRLPPTHAMREADADPPTPGWPRSLLGAATAGSGLGLLVHTALADPASADNRKSDVTTSLLLIGSAALLMPVLLRVSTITLRRLARRRSARAGRREWLGAATPILELVRANTFVLPARTASIATPALVVTGLVGSLLGAQDLRSAVAGTGHHAGRAGTLVLLAITTTYAVIGLANATITSTIARRREWRLLQLVGASVGQTRCVAIAEAALAASLGAAVGLLAAAVDTAGLTIALARAGRQAPITLPWSQLATATALSVLIAVITAALSVRRDLGRRSQRHVFGSTVDVA